MKKIKMATGIVFTFLFIFFSCQENVLDETANDLMLKSATKTIGFDDWGFNWNARQFNGYLINMMFGDSYFEGWSHYQQQVYQGEGIEFWDMVVSLYDYFPYLMPVELLDARVNAHWNEALISNEGVYPDTWIDAGAWITFKYSGVNEGKHWSHFRKLVSVKSTDSLVDGIWYNDKGEEVGFESFYWPDLTVIQVVNTGDVPPFFYDEYNSPWASGMGRHIH